MQEQTSGTSSSSTNRKMFEVWAVYEVPGKKDYWMKIGVAFPNRDDSVNIRLNAYPTGHTHIQMRERREFEDRRPAGEEGGRFAS